MEFKDVFPLYDEMAMAELFEDAWIEAETMDGATIERIIEAMLLVAHEKILDCYVEEPQGKFMHNRLWKKIEDRAVFEQKEHMRSMAEFVEKRERDQEETAPRH